MDISLENLQIKHDISVRSYNVCVANELTKLSLLIDFYLKEKSFIDLKNCGKASSLELENICQFYLNGSEELAAKYKQQEVTEIYRHLDNDTINRIIVLRFEERVEMLGERAKNIAKGLLRSFDYSVYEVFTYLHALNFNYLRIKNSGKLSNRQLTLFFNELLDFANDIAEKPIEVIKKKEIFLKIQSILDTLPLELKQWLEDNKEYIHSSFPFLEFLQKLIEQDVFWDKKKSLLIKYRSPYFNFERKNTKELAKKLGVTRERVRQLIQIDTLYIPFWNRVNDLVNLFGKRNIDFPFGEKEKFFAAKVTNEAPAFFTSEFLNVFYHKFINSELVAISEENAYSPKYLIHKDLLQIIDLEKFRQQLSELVNDKIEHTYELNLKGYLYSFLKKDLVSGEEWSAIEAVVDDLIFEEFGIITDIAGNIKIRRTKKKQTHEYIYDVLKAANEPLHLEEIANRLNIENKNYSENAEVVRSFLLRNNHLFIITAWSTYGLKEWEDVGREVGGTIRDVIEKYLKKNDKPQHIQAIADYVCQYRDTNKKSLFSNIQSDKLDKFKYFRYGFVGLTGVDYREEDVQFKPMPRTWRRILLKEYFSNSRSVCTFDALIEKLAERCEVMPIQIRSSLLDNIDEGRFKLDNNYLIINDN